MPAMWIRAPTTLMSLKSGYETVQGKQVHIIPGIIHVLTAR